jgi:hypothetical protein
MKDWDAELKKIDRRLESISDEALLPAPTAATPAAQAVVAEKRRTTNTFGVFARLVLVTILGLAMLAWPYDARCGVGLAAYLAATGVVALGGVWTAVWTWRHRSGRAHTLSLLILLWGIVLAAVEVMPRVGYARPTADRPAEWVCPAP